MGNNKTRDEIDAPISVHAVSCQETGDTLGDASRKNVFGLPFESIHPQQFSYTR